MSFRAGVAVFRGERIPHFNIIGNKKRWFALSGAILALSIFGLAFRGLNFSIDFKGGALLEYPLETEVTAEQVRSTMAEFGRADAEVQVVAGKQIDVRTKTLNDLGTRRGELIQALATQAGISVNDVNVQDVGPTWGKQISRKMVQALLIFLVLVSLYIAWRFEWKMAIAAQTALFHDVVITAGVYALVGREVTPNTVIAILTILGYSLYDTVVIFDKVQENTESSAMVARDGYSAVVNLSLNQTLMRSVNTSLVVLLPILSLLLFGGATLKDFAFALFIGVLSGTYSSIFVASPLLAALKEREPRNRTLRAKSQQRAAATSGAPGSVRPATPSGKKAKVPARVPSAEGEEAPAPKPKPKRKTTAKQRRRR